MRRDKFVAPCAALLATLFIVGCGSSDSEQGAASGSAGGTSSSLGGSSHAVGGSSSSAGHGGSSATVGAGGTHSGIGGAGQGHGGSNPAGGAAGHGNGGTGAPGGSSVVGGLGGASAAGGAATGGHQGAMGGTSSTAGTSSHGGTSSTGGNGSCAHDVCTPGNALTNACSSCASIICAGDTFCCTVAWDINCVGEAQEVCGSDCGVTTGPGGGGAAGSGPCGPDTCPDGCCDQTSGACNTNTCQFYGVPCGKEQSSGEVGVGNCTQCDGDKCDTCDTTTCAPCVPDCSGKSCGDPDDCGSRCEGTCAAGSFCSIALAQCATFCDFSSCPNGCCDDAGLCQVGTTDAACGSQGQSCGSCMGTGDACLPLGGSPSPGGACQGCNSVTCYLGCCTADGHCATEESDAHCGLYGGACVDCTVTGSVCGHQGEGICSDCVPQCNGKTCGESDGCGGLCNVPCPGAVCVVDSQTVPSGCHACDVTTCYGCCAADGTCQPGGSRHACGGSGVACADCGTGACAENDLAFPPTVACGACGSGCPPTFPGEMGQCVADGCGALCPGASCDGIPGNGTFTCELQGDGAQCVQQGGGGFCDPFQCASGCCQYQGFDATCMPGNLPSVCGTGGVSCVDCVANNETCDTTTHTCQGCTPDCSSKYSCGQSDGCGDKCKGASGNCDYVGSVCSDAGNCTCSVPGQQICQQGGNTLCIDTLSDPANCGACGAICPNGLACVNGTCDCGVGSHYCQSTTQNQPGTCTNLATDSKNCGACNSPCPGTLCDDGKCGTCGGGTMACPNSDPPACADVMTDSANCGACGNKCPDGITCLNGVCPCSGGEISCNGTCTDTTTDSMNCGGCNKPCPGSIKCAGSKCTCPGGTTLCGQSCTNTQVDPANCGACNMPCPTGHSCAAGMCL